MRSRKFPPLHGALVTLALLVFMASNAMADSQVLKDGSVQSIFLTSPKPGSEVMRGEEITVTWTSKNIEHVDIVLMKGSQEIGKIAQPLMINRGSAKVKIPKEIAPTPDKNQFVYYIGIYSGVKMVKDKRLVIIK